MAAGDGALPKLFHNIFQLIFVVLSQSSLEFNLLSCCRAALDWWDMHQREFEAGGVRGQNQWETRRLSVWKSLKKLYWDLNNQFWISVRDYLLFSDLKPCPWWPPGLYYHPIGLCWLRWKRLSLCFWPFLLATRLVRWVVALWDICKYISERYKEDNQCSTLPQGYKCNPLPVLMSCLHDLLGLQLLWDS